MSIGNAKIRFSTGTAISCIFLFAACGDESTEKIIQVKEDGIQIVADLDELPPCTESNNGELMFVSRESAMRICNEGNWYATMESATDGKNDSDGQNGVDGRNGSDGKDGLSCTAVALEDNSGLKVLCGGDSVGVLLNGSAGESSKGDKGDKGEKGADGAGCSMKKVDETMVRVYCGKDSTTLYTGTAPDISGGTEPVVLDSEKIAISLDEVSGVTQKGPFLSGSKVLVREMTDGRTLTQTGNSFNGKILNDNGEFKINARMLVSQYVMLEATGYYRNEVTGENSGSELTLFAITNVNDRNIVNVNLLTHLEYERVVYLVTQKKMKVKEAKTQAQKEVLALLDIDATGFSNSEDLNIAGSSDEDGALLAFSILFQGDRQVATLSELLSKISTDMKEDGTWDNAATKLAIAEWAADADSSGRLEKIRMNVANWGLSNMVPNFEKHVRHLWTKEYGLGDCTADSAGIVKAATAGKRKGTQTRYICRDARWVIASDFEKDTYGWKDGEDGSLKNGDVTGRKYVFDKLGSFNGSAGWRIAESIEQQYGGCIETLYDSIRTDKVYAYYYTCKESSHTWVREVNYLVVDTQNWPDSTDGKVKWGDSVGVATPGDRNCYVWDESAEYNGWRRGNKNDCSLGLLGCTAKRGGEMRKASSGRYYSCSNNSWTEITDDLYINTYLYRCTIDGEGDNVFKEGDLVYGIEKTKTRYACENEKWRMTATGEEQIGKACTTKLQGMILRDTLTCDANNWRATIFYDYPLDKDWTNPDLIYGILTDDRDGRTYKTIEINGFTVMAENLKYVDEAKNPYLKNNSWCYNNDTINCLKGGRYYTWTAAMDIDGKWQNAQTSVIEGMIEKPHRGICPKDWHIPTKDEWSALFEKYSYTDQQAVGSVYWKLATNITGFTALPVSFRDGSRYTGFSYTGFWSASEYGAEPAYAWCIWNNNAGLCASGSDAYYKRNGFSIRCIKD